jgi:hypothetical protein
MSYEAALIAEDASSAAEDARAQVGITQDMRYADGRIERAILDGHIDRPEAARYS